MRYATWSLFGALVLIALSFLHYTLPRQDVVRVVGVEVQRVNTGNSWFYAGSEPSNADGTRDVKFINAIRENGNPIVYRNEDTGWGWPPYFKFDSSNVQAEAADLTSTAAAPTWVLVRKYGWRNTLFSTYSNAVTVREVAGPSDKPLPFMNIAILVGLAALMFFIYRALNRFWDKRVDPIIDQVTDVFDGDNDKNDTSGTPPKRSFMDRIRGK